MSLPLHPRRNIYYKRSRFTTWLPPHYRYTQSHFWMAEEEAEQGGEAGVWRVGLTRFATRMLGDLVEQGYTVSEGERVTVGQAIGHLEGFKAVSDLYCVVDGVFAGANAKLNADPTLVDSDEYGQGWLYRVRGVPDPNSLDVSGYIQVLDATIDKMRAQYE